MQTHKEKRQREKMKRYAIITIAVVFSIILYLAGVFSGLYASKTISIKTESDINNLKNETKSEINLFRIRTEQNVEFMKEYIKILDSNLKNFQVEQSFTKNLNHDQMCRFNTIMLDDLMKKMRFFWSKMPTKIEEYERNNILSDEYLLLKEDYTQLSLRTWVVARNNYLDCNNDFVNGLYFYSINCTSCIIQGNELDKFQMKVIESDRSVIIFTVDINADNPIIKYLKEQNNITSTPAVIINDKVFKNKVYTSQEMLKELEIK